MYSEGSPCAGTCNGSHGNNVFNAVQGARRSGKPLPGFCGRGFGLLATYKPIYHSLEQHMETREYKLTTASSDKLDAERRAAIPSGPRPHRDVISATKNVTPVLVSSATSDAVKAQQEINIIQ